MAELKVAMVTHHKRPKHKSHTEAKRQKGLYWLLINSSAKHYYMDNEHSSYCAINALKGWRAKVKP